MRSSWDASATNRRWASKPSRMGIERAARDDVGDRRRRDEAQRAHDQDREHEAPRLPVVERQVEATLDEPRRGAFVGDGHRDHADLDPVGLDRADVQPVGGAPERAGVREPRQRLAGAVEEDPALGVEHQQHGVRDRRRVLAALLLLLAVRQLAVERRDLRPHGGLEGPVQVRVE